MQPVLAAGLQPLSPQELLKLLSHLDFNSFETDFKKENVSVIAFFFYIKCRLYLQLFACNRSAAKISKAWTWKGCARYPPIVLALNAKCFYAWSGM